MIEVLKYLKAGAIVPVDVQTTKALVDALRQAIAELESQEPVAWRWKTHNGYAYSEQHYEGEDGQPLYTHSPQRTWVGLTDEEVDQGLLRSNHALQTAGAWRDGVEWATKQLKEKNT
jgi:hypothetical protein